METIDFQSANAFGLEITKLDDEISWYRREYARAARILCDIVDKNVFCFEIGGIIDFKNSPEHNNIIAITGDRGSGKSTVMHTIMAHLDSSSNERGSYPIDNLEKLAFVNEEDPNEAYKTRASFKEKEFHILPPLDPCKLPKGETLLGFTVAYIYNDIRLMLESSKYDSSVDFSKVLTECEKAYEAIKIWTIGNSKALEQNPDDLEMLGKLANTSRLRMCLMELVAQYLRLKTTIRKRGNDDDEIIKKHIMNTFLIIPIDDVDTNIEAGYNLVEELRNFFFIPQVVILMAVKLEQLTDLVHQHFLEAFSTMLKADDVLDVQPEEMATKYIQKLIPDHRRIHLQPLTLHSLETIKVKTNKLKNSNVKDIFLVNYFLELMWQKCGILLAKNAFGGHGLIPLNLRSLHQSFELLEDMPDISLDSMRDSAAEKAKLRKNIRRLEAWISDTVSSNAIPRGMALIFRKLIAHPNIGLNGYLVDLLVQYSTARKTKRYTDQKKTVHFPLFGQDVTAISLSGIETLPENISLGDVLYLLNSIERYNSSAGVVHFAAAVRFLYSLRLTECLYLTEENSESGFQEASRILGGLVYNPAISLTPNGQEWSPNCDALGVIIKIPPPDNASEQVPSNSAPEFLYYLNGKQASLEPNENNDRSGRQVSKMAMSLLDAVWISNFIVQYGSRIKKRQLFLHKEVPYTETSFYPESVDLFGYISVNWMGFVTNLLDPKKHIERLLSYVMNTLNINLDRIFDSGEGDKLNEDWKDANKLITEINIWRNTFRASLPIYSVDVINLLLSNLEKNRLKLDPEEIHYIGKARDFFTLKASLLKELKKSLNNTALASESLKASGSPSETQKKKQVTRKKIINAFESCPVLCGQAVDNALGGYNTERLETDELKFDWIMG